MKIPFEYNSVPMAPSHNTGPFCRRAKKSEAIHIKNTVWMPKPGLTRRVKAGAGMGVECCFAIIAVSTSHPTLTCEWSSQVEANLNRNLPDSPECVLAAVVRWGNAFLNNHSPRSNQRAEVSRVCLQQLCRATGYRRCDDGRIEHQHHHGWRPARIDGRYPGSNHHAGVRPGQPYLCG